MNINIMKAFICVGIIVRGFLEKRLICGYCCYLLKKIPEK